MLLVVGQIELVVRNLRLINIDILQSGVKKPAIFASIQSLVTSLVHRFHIFDLLFFDLPELLDQFDDISRLSIANSVLNQIFNL